MKPALAGMIVRGTPMKLVSSAYWVALNLRLHRRSMNAVRADAPIPRLTVSTATTNESARTFGPVNTRIENASGVMPWKIPNPIRHFLML